MYYPHTPALVEERKHEQEEAREALEKILPLLGHLQAWQHKQINKRFYKERGLITVNDYGTEFTEYDICSTGEYEYRGAYSIYLARNHRVYTKTRDTADVLAATIEKRDELEEEIARLDREIAAYESVPEEEVLQALKDLRARYFNKDNYQLWDQIREDHELRGYCLTD